ncbi:MAG: hypothetical protein AB7E08_04765 [Candidatus Omnitrophota bacterium]
MATKNKFLVIFVSCLFLCGMAPAGQKLSQQTRIEKYSIENVLSNIESVYEGEDLIGFKELLDKDFENSLTFISNLENYFYSVKFLNLYLVLDTYLTEKDRVLVKLHWFKKAIDNSGAFTKTKGSSEFVFRNTTEGLKLILIRKDNPFF